MKIIFIPETLKYVHEFCEHRCSDAILRTYMFEKTRTFFLESRPYFGTPML